MKFILLLIMIVVCGVGCSSPKMSECSSQQLSGVVVGVNHVILSDHEIIVQDSISGNRYTFYFNERGKYKLHQHIKYYKITHINASGEIRVNYSIEPCWYHGFNEEFNQG